MMSNISDIMDCEELDDEFQRDDLAQAHIDEHQSESQENNSAQRIDQNNNCENSRAKFRKLEELNLVFRRAQWDKNRQSEVECLECGYRVTSNRYSRTINHVKQCDGLNDELRQIILTKYREMIGLKAKSRSDIRNIKLTKMILQNNLPIAFVSSSTFIDFVKDLNPEYKHASRELISLEFVPNISMEVKEQFIRTTKYIDDYSLSIEFDSWTDLIRRSVLGLIATKPDGSRYVLDLADISRTGQPTDVLLFALKEVLKNISPMKINSIISDSAANCKSARKQLTQDPEYCHLLEHRCFAHFLNNIGSDLADRTPYDAVTESASCIANHLSRDSKFLSRLSDLHIRRIQSVTRTRWYSTVNMFETLLVVRLEALEYLESREKRERNNSSECILLLKDCKFWNDLENVVRYMRPLANCIAVAERDEGSLGEAVKSLLEYIKLIFEDDWRDEFTLAAVKSLLKFFNKDKLGESEMNLMLASYFLDRRHKMDYITRSGTELVLKRILEVAAISNVSGGSVDSVIYREFTQFRLQQGLLSRKAEPEKRASDWWREQASIDSYLRIVALRLANLKSSSANIERIFSLVRHIQGLSRTNFSIETLTSITRSKVALSQRELDDETYDTITYRARPKNVAKPVIEGNRRSTLPPNTRLQSSQPLRHTRNSSQASILVDDEEARLEMLEDNLKNYFIELNEIIDFTIVNQLCERIEFVGGKQTNLDIAGTLKRLREDMESGQTVISNVDIDEPPQH